MDRLNYNYLNETHYNAIALNSFCGLNTAPRDHSIWLYFVASNFRISDLKANVYEPVTHIVNWIAIVKFTVGYCVEYWFFNNESLFAICCWQFTCRVCLNKKCACLVLISERVKSQFVQAYFIFYVVFLPAVVIWVLSNKIGVDIGGGFSKLYNIILPIYYDNNNIQSCTGCKYLCTH